MQGDNALLFFMLDRKHIDDILSNLTEEEFIHLTRRLIPTGHDDFLNSNYFAKKFYNNSAHYSMVSRGIRKMDIEKARPMMELILEGVNKILVDIHSFEKTDYKKPMKTMDATKVREERKKDRVYLNVKGKEVFSKDIKKFKDGLVVEETEDKVHIQIGKKIEKMPKKLFKRIYNY